MARPFVRPVVRLAPTSSSTDQAIPKNLQLLLQNVARYPKTHRVYASIRCREHGESVKRHCFSQASDIMLFTKRYFMLRAQARRPPTLDHSRASSKANSHD
ncbi:hypothetical protein H4Q26_017601 [Puccinia striiformis f. sp. tritici PST-130]|nr:hypothetical protein H4Q26_017601 [Puccinia striiformis f. sp. tritici PST-130]